MVVIKSETSIAVLICRYSSGVNLVSKLWGSWARI